MNINKDYICNSSNYRAKRNDTIKYIVIHYVGAEGSAKDNATYYSSTANIGASAHYFVGHDAESGKIYQSVPEDACAWHCGHDAGGKYYHPYCRNDNSIGIEMCTHRDGKGGWYFDKSTVDNTVELVKMLMKKHNISADNVVRHYDVTHKTCPAPFVNIRNAWENFKKELTRVEELESVNDIVWELAERGIITDRELWLKKLNDDTNDYWLARKIVKHLRENGV